MILKLVNNTANIKTYASGAVTLPANGTVTVVAANQLATAVDGNLFSDVSQNNVSVSDNINSFVVNDGLVYLNRIVLTQTSINDASGTAITSTLVGSKQSLDVNVSQNANNADNIGSGSITALNVAVTATTQGCSSIQFVVAGTWSATLTIQGTVDGVNWNITQGDVDATDTISSTITLNSLITIPCAGFSQVRLIATAYASGTATVTYDASVGVSLVEIYSTNASSLLATIRLNDGSGNVINSNNNQLQTRDVINTAGQNRAQSITTSSAEALGGTTILVNRKFISLTPTNGTIYWGFTSGITTSSGTPIFKNQSVTIGVTDNVHVYVIAAQTTDCRIAEGS